MVTKTEVATREQSLTEGARREVAERGPEPLMVSANYVQQTVRSIAMLQDMTRNLLKRGRDFGRTPGTPQDGLWDPGASLIISSFNCYVGQRRVLSLVDEDNKISVILEVPIISRQTGQEVGSGVGGASTLETKYKYRWFYSSELEGMGYTKEQIAALKTDKKHEGRYRIDNPEHGELLNTLIKMASKRAEVDAAEALPGVSSVLREMFAPPEQSGSKGGPPATKYEGARWQRFWGEVQRLGYSEAEAHTALKVKSMQDWLAAGKSLDEAIAELVRLAAEASGMDPVTEYPTGVRKPEQGSDPKLQRSYDKTMVQSAAGKLRWDAKRLAKELQDRFDITSLDDAPDDKLHEAVSKLTDLATMA
ncbi:MAG: hypothetical protein V1737_06450 [Chloroflexota bacterium]